MISNAPHMLAVKATFDGDHVILPEEVCGTSPGNVIVIFELSTTKKRPALIVSPASFSRHMHDVVLLALTSQDQNEPALALAQWQSVGLPKPSWVKP